jgi:filamentous hemagglutinin family protein
MALLGCWTPQAVALPQNGQVLAGEAQINQVSPGQLNIRQSSNRAVINWNSFSIDVPEQVNFVQPSASSATLNRVTGNSPSTIAGKIDANGQVMLVNPNGILFTPTAQINVAGLLATTLDIKDSDFMQGNLRLQQVLGQPLSTVENQGQITVKDGGYAGLVAPAVANSGVIQAKLGKVILAAGTQATLDFFGDGLISLAVDPQLAQQVIGADGTPLKSLITQSGTINADGGSVVLSARAGAAMVDQVINMSGAILAQSVEKKNGTIILSGGDTGTVSVSGKLDISGTDKGETSGTVQVLGSKVGLFDQAEILASGDVGGGIVLIGGDYKGQGAVPNAQMAYFSPEAIISADALTQGNGGKVIVWSDEATRFYGQISAKGGTEAGNGGFVETSSKGFLESSGSVDASAPKGTTPGTWLLDPYNVKIGDTGYSVTNPLNNPFAPTTNDAQVSATSINNALNDGTSVTITTGSLKTIAQEGNITVSSPISKTKTNASAGVPTLSLIAANNIDVKDQIGDQTFDPMLGTNVNQKFNVDLKANNNINVTPDIKVQGFVTISGASIRAGLIDTSSVSSKGGDVTLTSTKGNIEVKYIDTSVGGARAGNITINAFGLFHATGYIPSTKTVNFGIGKVTYPNGKDFDGSGISIAAVGSGTAVGGEFSDFGKISITSGGTPPFITGVHSASFEKDENGQIKSVVDLIIKPGFTLPDNASGAVGAIFSRITNGAAVSVYGQFLKEFPLDSITIGFRTGSSGNGGGNGTGDDVTDSGSGPGGQVSPIIQGGTQSKQGDPCTSSESNTVVIDQEKLKNTPFTYKEQSSGNVPKTLAAGCTPSQVVENKTQPKNPISQDSSDGRGDALPKTSDNFQNSQSIGFLSPLQQGENIHR